ncbi:MAG TPA: polyphosphate polymerase domain-containing protein [Iamia sp.]
MTLIDDALLPVALAPVGLDELVGCADLQTRRDRKYLVPCGRAVELAAVLPTGTRVLRIGALTCFRYESVYFDTPDHASYLGAARRRPRRFKVRTRTYTDSGSCMLEVKVRDARGHTVKHRQPYTLDDRHHLSAAGRAFVAAFPQGAPFADRMTNVLATVYDRTTLLLPDGATRITIDLDVRWTAPEGGGASLPGLAVVETKTAGAPSEVDRALWRMGIRPSAISKFGTGLAAVTPELPANKWHRVLGRHVALRAT